MDNIKLQTQKQADEIRDKFLAEVEHLLHSGGIDPENCNLGLLFGVALENVADGYLRDSKSTKQYQALRRI